MNREAFVAHLGIEVTTLEIWLERRWLVPAAARRETQFSETDVARARLIQDLGQGFGVNPEGIDIILHLLDQLHGVRGALAAVRQSMVRPADPV